MYDVMLNVEIKSAQHVVELSLVLFHSKVAVNQSLFSLMSRGFVERFNMAAAGCDFRLNGIVITAAT